MNPNTSETAPVTLTGLAKELLASLMPETDNISEALTQMGFRRTCAAVVVYGLIQKAGKGDTSAAKFLKELNGEEETADALTPTGLETLSDAALMQLAGLNGKEWINHS